MPTKNIQASRATIAYWETAKTLLEKVGRYISADKLRANLEDESTAWKVSGVFHRYYNGSDAALYKAIVGYKNAFNSVVKRFNIQCQIVGVRGITDSGRLFELLKDESRRKYYRRAIDKRLKADEVVSLQTIEKEYCAR